MMPKQLVDPPSGEILAEIDDNQLLFYDKEMENELKINGISIPFRLKEEFEGKRIVEFNDPLFIRAFIEVYCPLNLKETGFRLGMKNHTTSA